MNALKGNINTMRCKFPFSRFQLFIIYTEEALLERFEMNQ